ncbi:MAG: PilZ domain-containing protein [Candidatus Omnitrophica bacterium]|nr:PilZ domain-containing protein [Candidatus Omnitrophota bacterium]
MLYLHSMIKVKERRQKRRVWTAFPVYCKTKMQKGFFAISKDLSETGACVMSNHLLPLNRYFNIEINLIDSCIRLKAKAIWRKEVGGEVKDFGIKFTSSDKERKIIASFVSALDN